VPPWVTGEFEIVNTDDGADSATLVTVPEPKPPGMSESVSARKVGVAALPVVGPAKKVLALSVVKPMLSVPPDVTGELAIVNTADGADNATLVTVPDPKPPGMSERVNARNVGVAALPEVGPAKKVFAVSVVKLSVSVPPKVTGEFAMVNTEDGAERPTLVTVPVAKSAGRSDSVSVRKVGVAALPLVGPAKIVLALSVVNDALSVPLCVTGEFDTEKIDGSDNPTLETPDDVTEIAATELERFSSAPCTVVAVMPSSCSTRSLRADSRKLRRLVEIETMQLA
jgi:hypothetical protein